VCMLGFYILSQVLIMLVSTQVIFATPWM